MKSNKKSKPTVDYINYIAKTEDLPQLIELIEVMEQNDKYKYFHNDVERKTYPDYYKEIKYPMSFATLRKKYLIKSNISENHIYNFYKDLFLIWRNCWKYNTEDSDISETAVELGNLANKFIRKNILIKYSNEKHFNSEDSHKINSSYSFNKNSRPNSKTSHSLLKENNSIGREKINLSLMSKEEKLDNNTKLLNDDIVNDEIQKNNIKEENKNDLIDFLNDNLQMKQKVVVYDEKENSPFDLKNNNKNKLNRFEHKNLMIEDFTKKIEEEFGELNKNQDQDYLYSRIDEDNFLKNEIIQTNVGIDEQIAPKNIEGEFFNDLKEERNFDNKINVTKIDAEAQKENSISNIFNEKIIDHSERSIIENNNEITGSILKILENKENEIHCKNSNVINLNCEKSENKKKDIINENNREEENKGYQEIKIAKKPRYTKSLREKADDLQDDIINFTNRLRSNKSTDIINNINLTPNAISEINFKRERKPVDYKDRDTLKNLLRHSKIRTDNVKKKPISKQLNLTNHKQSKVNQPIFKQRNILSIKNLNNSNLKTQNKVNKSSENNYNYSNNFKKNIHEKSLHGLDPFPETIQKRIPKKPQKYADDEFESENINISGKDRNEASLIKNKKEIEQYKKSINDIISNIANCGRIIKNKIDDANKKENNSERNDNKLNGKKKNEKEVKEDIMEDMFKEISPSILKYKDVSLAEIINLIKRVKAIDKKTLFDIMTYLADNFKECIYEEYRSFYINFASFNRKTLYIVNKDLNESNFINNKYKSKFLTKKRKRFFPTRDSNCL